MQLRRTASTGNLPAIRQDESALTRLPEAMQHLVVTALDDKDRSQLAQVNRAWSHVINGPTPSLTPPKARRTRGDAGTQGVEKPVPPMHALMPPETLRALIEAANPRHLSHWLSKVGKRSEVKELINRTRYDGVTPLMLGAYLGSKQVCDVLLSHGADATASDSMDFDASRWAANGGHELLSIALHRAKDAQLSATRVAHVTVSNAFYRRNVFAAEHLLRSRLPNDTLPETTWASAVFSDAHAVTFTNLLLRYAPEQAAQKVNQEHLFVGAFANLAHPVKYVRHLENLGIHASAELLASSRFLEAVFSNPNATLSTLDFLNTQPGFPKSFAAVNGAEPSLIHLAARNKLELVKFLVEHGAPIGQRDAQGHTPLMSAVGVSKGETVAYLLKQGSDVLAALPLAAEQACPPPQGEAYGYEPDDHDRRYFFAPGAEVLRQLLNSSEVTARDLKQVIKTLRRHRKEMYQYDAQPTDRLIAELNGAHAANVGATPWIAAMTHFR